MNPDFRADLHCHSYYSDGTNTPQELIDLAIEKKLSGLSITDHDTVAAYPEALLYAEKCNFSLLTGIEFSASYLGEPIHVLGYGIDLENATLLGLCEKHRKRRHERNVAILKNLEKMGYFIDIKKLKTKSGIIGRPHIALALIEKGVVDSVKEAFDRFLGEGKPAYTPGQVVSVEETIATIHGAKGKAILAHPQLIRKNSTFEKMLRFPFDGLEGYYARLPLHIERKFIQKAQKKGWLVTGGSDFHGAVKPQAELGSSWVNEATFDALRR